MTAATNGHARSSLAVEMDCRQKAEMAPVGRLWYKPARAKRLGALSIPAPVRYGHAPDVTALLGHGLSGHQANTRQREVSCVV